MRPAEPVLWRGGAGSPAGQRWPARSRAAVRRSEAVATARLAASRRARRDRADASDTAAIAGLEAARASSHGQDGRPTYRPSARARSARPTARTTPGEASRPATRVVAAGTSVHASPATRLTAATAVTDGARTSGLTGWSIGSPGWWGFTLEPIPGGTEGGDVLPRGGRSPHRSMPPFRGTPHNLALPSLTHIAGSSERVRRGTYRRRSGGSRGALGRRSGTSRWQ